MTLEAQGLTCVRGGRVLFADLNFRLGPGQALVLRGPNGSGKTSLLRLAAGLLRPAGGGLSWNGQAATADLMAYQAKIAFVGHIDALKPVFTVAENLAFWARFAAGPERVDAALERFGLAPLHDLPASFLSAGQRRRLSLARLVAAPAPLWLLDEPTASLDDEGAATVVSVISEHMANGGIALVAAHGPLDVPGRELRLGGLPPGKTS